MKEFNFLQGFWRLRSAKFNLHTCYFIRIVSQANISKDFEVSLRKPAEHIWSLEHFLNVLIGCCGFDNQPLIKWLSSLKWMLGFRKLYWGVGDKSCCFLKCQTLRCVGYKRFSILDCPERTKDQLNYLRVGAKTPSFPTDLERKSKFCIILFIILFKLGDRIITVCLPT